MQPPKPTPLQPDSPLRNVPVREPVKMPTHPWKKEKAA